MKWSYVNEDTLFNKRSWAEIVFVPCMVQVQIAHKCSLLQKSSLLGLLRRTSLTLPLGVLESCCGPDRSSLSPPVCRVKLYLVLCKIWWGGRQVLQHPVSDPFALTQTTLETGASGSWTRYGQAHAGRPGSFRPRWCLPAPAALLATSTADKYFL